MADFNNMEHGDSTSGSSDDELNYDPSHYPQMNADLSMPGSKKEMINVLVTGFGPFRDHNVNASWEAVKELKKLQVAHNVNLITEEIPVDYQTVKLLIPQLWEKYQPRLVVHVGVSGFADELTFETVAHNEGYKMPDVTGNTAPAQCCVKGGLECLRPALDITKLCEDVNQSGCLAMAVKSSNAGRYLCEYIFYASLHQNTSCVSFIHVPSLGNPYSSAELGHALKCAVQSMLKQLDLYHPLSPPDSQLLQQLREQSMTDTKANSRVE